MLGIAMRIGATKNEPWSKVRNAMEGNLLFFVCYYIIAVGLEQWIFNFFKREAFEGTLERISRVK